MGLGCMASPEPTKLAESLCIHARGCGAETPYWIVMKFCTGVGVDVVTHIKFNGQWLRGFGDSGGQISHFSIDFN